MKKRMKVLSLVLCLAVTTVFASGCGAKNDGTTEEKSEEKTVVQFSYPAYGYDSDKEQEFWDSAIAEFEKENENIQIEMTNEDWAEVFTKWDNYIADKDTPDIGICDYVDATAYGILGSVQNVNDVIEDLGGADTFTDDAQLAKDGDNWWSVPFVSANLVLGYRADLLKEAGYDAPPANWDELKEMAIALTKDDQYGLGMNVSESWLSNQLYISFVKAAGGSFEDENGNITVTSDPQNLVALEYIKSLYESGAIPQDCQIWEGGEDINGLATGQLAMAILWGGQGSTVADNFPDQVDNIKFTTLPVGPSGESGSFVGNAGLFLFNDSKHPEEAKQFIKYLLQEDVQQKWAAASGNVSPVKSVAENSELQKESWYKAIAEQTATGTNYYIGGIYNEALSLFAQDDGFGPNVYAVVTGADPAEELQKGLEKIQKIQKDLE